MGRARQGVSNVTATARRSGDDIDERTDPFAAVLGPTRGLQPDAALARDLAGVNLDELFEEGDTEAIAAAYFRFRGAPGAKNECKLLHEWLAEDTAETVWHGWWNQGMDSTLRMLGLGVRSRSPWLLSQEHRKRPEGHIRTVHIADLRPEAIWVGDDAGRPGNGSYGGYDVSFGHGGNGDLRSLCGLDASALNTALNTKRGHHHLHRGAWRTPSKFSARRCERCAALAQDLTIPALRERDHSTIRDGAFTSEHKPELQRVVGELLPRERSYEDVVARANEEARAVILERFVRVCSEDPMPVVMAVLPVAERQGLTRFAQTDLLTRLQTLQWRAILEDALPDTFNGGCRPQALHDMLLGATENLSY